MSSYWSDLQPTHPLHFASGTRRFNEQKLDNSWIFAWSFLSRLFLLMPPLFAVSCRICIKLFLLFPNVSFLSPNPLTGTNFYRGCQLDGKLLRYQTGKRHPIKVQLLRSPKLKPRSFLTILAPDKIMLWNAFTQAFFAFQQCRSTQLSTNAHDLANAETMSFDPRKRQFAGMSSWIEIPPHNWVTITLPSTSRSSCPVRAFGNYLFPDDKPLMFFARILLCLFS